MQLHLPFPADSLLGLIPTAPSLVGGDQLALLGVTLLRSSQQRIL
jgi:hypothetical protein